MINVRNILVSLSLYIETSLWWFLIIFIDVSNAVLFNFVWRIPIMSKSTKLNMIIYTDFIDIFLNKKSSDCYKFLNK